ncbi:MAG: radical SAM protein [Pseudomonadota bacterium]
MKNLIIEVTSRCNLSCSMCLRQTWQEATGDMSMETFKGLIPAFFRLDSINLSGYGEPFLNPQLIDMILLAKEHGSPFGRVELTTNGTLIDRRIAQEVINAGLDSISLSLDSLDLKKFSGIREKRDLESVLESLETFRGIRKNAQKPFKIALSFVAMKRNIEELPRLVHFAADRGVDAVWVNNVLPPTEDIARDVLYDSFSDEVLTLFARVRDRYNELEVAPRRFPLLVQKLYYSIFNGFSLTESLSSEEIQALRVSKTAVSEAIAAGGDFSMIQLLERKEDHDKDYWRIFEESKNIAVARNVELHLPLIVPRTRRECNFIKNETCFITWDGWVRPCNQLSHNIICFHYGRRKRVESVGFGKVPNGDLWAIWESEPYRTFRETVGEFPFSPCGDCSVAKGCDLISPDSPFLFDCYANEQPCGDCLWSRGILQCP